METERPEDTYPKKRTMNRIKPYASLLSAILAVAASRLRRVVLSAQGGTLLWVSRYDAPGVDSASSVAASPNGSTVFVTGSSQGANDTSDYLTIAYEA
jgi:hypothetical protein